MARTSAYGMPAVPVKYSITRLGGGVTAQGIQFPGGLDLTTPSLALQPGALRACQNFECSQSGGYSRIAGYERLDGQPKPHLATYTLVQVDVFTNVPVVGDTITQAGSGATGVVILVNNIVDAYYVVVTKRSGLFDFTGAISVGATPIGTAITQTVSITPLMDAQWLALAADNYRADITSVPGSGSILGVVGIDFNGTDHVYAFRVDAGGSTVCLYESTAAGWALVPFFDEVAFTTGSVSEPVDGEQLIQGGVTATIKRCVWSSGTFSGGTAAGNFVITNVSGGHFVAGAATTTSGSNVVLTGAETAITLTPGGQFQFDKANFSGQLSSRRIYGCDGVNRCFEFDGETLVPISTGLSPDAPSCIRAHKNFLFVARESSVVHSGPGTPFKWSSTNGGGEIATGDIVTNLITLPGAQTTAALGVFMRSNTAVLYGTDKATFNFVLFNTGTGALPRTAQNLFDTFVYDDMGVINTQTTLNYGNFSSSTLTKNILPFIQQEKGRVCASSLNRSKSQYRAWFNDGFGLWITSVNQQFVGSAIVFFPSPVLCADDASLADGGTTSYFGSSDGYVYELDVGTSFDGDVIDAYITMAWDPIKTPRILKRMRALSVEMQGNAYAAIAIGYQLAYGSSNVGQPGSTDATSGFSGAPLWDSFTWDSFVWDGQTLMPTDISMSGTAENVQVTISATTNYLAEFNVNSLIYHYSDRRGMRV